MIVAVRFARDRSRSTLGWSIGIIATIALTALFWPSVRGTSSFDELVNDLPDALKALIGAQGSISLGSPAGYLNARLFATLLPVLLLVFGIGLGALAIAGTEESGTLELLLANPVSRTRVALERGLTVVASLLFLTAVAGVALVVLGPPLGMLDGIQVSRLGAALGAVAILGYLHAAIAFGVGAATGRRAAAVATAVSVAAVGYLLAGLLATSGGPRWLRELSPWHLLLDRNVLATGVPVAPLVAEVAVGTAIALFGIWRFSRRDLR